MRTSADLLPAVERELHWDSQAESDYIRDGTCGDRLLQNPPELADFFVWMEQQKIESYLEIGIWTGRLLSLVDVLFQPKLLAAADLGIAKQRGLPYRVPERCKFFAGSSRSEEFKHWRSELGHVDLVFIDGDHSYDGVRSDLEMELAMPHRFLVLHDIANDHPTCSGVKRLWGELEGKKHEFIREVPGGKLKLGIGVLEVDKTVSQKNPVVCGTEPTVDVFVQSIERPEWAATQVSLEESDIGSNYRRIVHPSGLTLQQFVLRFLEVMENESDADYCLRLEDDVLVNRHILHNVRTWPALSDPRFGLGWLFDPGGMWSDRSVIDRIYQRVGKDGWHIEHQVPRSFGVLFPRTALPEIRDYVQTWFKSNRPDFYDLAFSPAVSRMKRWTCVHAPSLIEHDSSLPSALGHSTDGHDSSGGMFRSDWRRPYA